MDEVFARVKVLQATGCPNGCPEGDEERWTAMEVDDLGSGTYTTVCPGCGAIWTARNDVEVTALVLAATLEEVQEGLPTTFEQAQDLGRRVT